MRKSRISEKIRKQKDIQQLFKSTSVYVAGARLFYRANNSNFSRILVSPGKKYGNAVERNYIKRVARDIVRNNRPRFFSGYDVALVFYSGAYTYVERVNQVLMLLQKMQI